MDQIDSDLFLLLRIQENNIAEVWLETSTVQMLEYVVTLKQKQLLDVLKLPPCTLTSEVHIASRGPLCENI